LTKERRDPVHVEIARDLGIAIVTGERPVASVLPGEIELSSNLGVARSVIREALRMIAAKGLIESRPRAGTRVRERAAWNLLDPQMLGWMFEGAPPRDFVRSLFELRLIVEPAGAELAAVKRNAAQLSRMGHALEVMAQQGLHSEEGQHADQQFHATLLEATGNELLVNLSATIGAAVRWTTYFKFRASHRPYDDAIPRHRRLFEAIANGDADGARAATVALVKKAQLDTEAALDA